MAKQKEIKFRRDGKLFYGQQNGVKYSIPTSTLRCNTVRFWTIPASKQKLLLLPRS